MKTFTTKHASVFHVRRKRIFVVPTYVQTTTGLRMHDEPVTVIEADDADALRSAIVARLSAEVRVVPHPRQEDWPKLKPVVPMYAKLRSYAELERAATLWQISFGADGARVERWKRGEPRGYVGDAASCWPIPAIDLETVADASVKRILAP